jgi:Lipopolysaccharide-assembly
MGRIVLLVLAGLLSGCAGYTLGPVKPTPMRDIQRLAVPVFRNRTLEPDIEALVTTTLIKQLQQDGTYDIVGADQADAEVEGSIMEIRRVKARSVQGNTFATAEFKLYIKLRYEVLRAQTGALVDRRDVQGETSFFVGDDVQSQERQAIPLAVQDAAVRIVSYLSEGW